MEKLIKYFLILLCFQSCLQSKKSDDFIEVKDEIIADTIKSIAINRGILNLHKKYNLYSNCTLVYRDSFPKWIQNHNDPEFKSNDYIFRPSITDIEVPYVLYKYKNDKYFYIIKNNDTLKFELNEF